MEAQAARRAAAGVVPLPKGALDLREPAVMGVLNVTPDSFSDGGLWRDPRRAAAHGKAMARAGASVIDVGGESTRPGAEPVGAREEMKRVLPVVKALAKAGLRVSIDTVKAEVAAAALEAGASIVNDVTALGDPEMGGVAARARAAVILMHMKGTPRTMQDAPRYEDVVREIVAFLRARMRLAERAGVGRERLLVDPGIGFGKRAEDNVEILRRLGEFAKLGRPVVVGTSRKRFIGHYLGGRDAGARVWGTAATVAAAVLRGASLVRVHDVAEMADVVRMAALMRG